MEGPAQNKKNTKLVGYQVTSLNVKYGNFIVKHTNYKQQSINYMSEGKMS